MIELRQLTVDDANDLSVLLQSASSNDRMVFNPFEFDVSEVRRQILKSASDSFYGLFAGEGANLAGFYMLRGLGEGFESPMYGVFIGPSFRKLGLARLTLYHALSVCRLCNYPSLLLKVYASNKAAIALYRSCGFEFVREHSGQVVMELLIPKSERRLDD